jgi:hypothetical protein
VSNPLRIRLNLEFSRSTTHVLWHDSMTMGSIPRFCHRIT